MTQPIKLNRSYQKWIDLWAVESESRPGEHYVIGRSAAGEFSCSCPRWKFKRESCKHIQAVQRFITTAPAAQPGPALVITPALEKTLSRFAMIE